VRAHTRVWFARRASRRLHFALFFERAAKYNEAPRRCVGRANLFTSAAVLTQPRRTLFYQKKPRFFFYKKKRAFFFSKKKPPKKKNSTTEKKRNDGADSFLIFLNFTQLDRSNFQ
jgi:hypothetical protein